MAADYSGPGNTINGSKGATVTFSEKAYVVKIDVKKNQVIVSYDKQEPDLMKKEITIDNWHWI